MARQCEQRQGLRMHPLLLAVVLATGALAFHVPIAGSGSSASRHSCRPLQASRGASDDQPGTPQQSRRELVQSTATVLGALGVAGLAAAAPASAASPVISEIKIRESVKGVKESVEALKLYEDFVTQQDFYGIKKSLRVPPVSEIRRDCRRIIAGLEGEAVKNDVNKAYDKFITALEEVDLMSTRAIQKNSTMSEDEVKRLGASYGETQKQLGEVLRLVLTTRYADPINVRLETAGL